MTAYIIMTLSSIMIAWIGLHTVEYKMGNKENTVLIIASALPLIIIAGFRYYVGTDFGTYVLIFNKLRSGSSYYLKEYINEFIFVLVNKTAAFFKGGYTLAFILFAICFMLPVFSQIYRDSPYPLLSIFLLISLRYFFAYMNIMRQCIAGAILFYSVRYIEKDDLKGFLICLIIATGFHNSSILFLPVYLLRNAKINWVVVFSVALILWFSGEYLTKAIRFLIEETQYGEYMGSKFDTERRSFLNVTLQSLILILGLVGNDGSKKYRIYLIMQVFTLWGICLMGRAPLIERLRFIYALGGIILMPLSIANFKDSSTRGLLKISIIICFSVYVLYDLLGQDSYYVVPYRSVLGLY